MNFKPITNVKVYLDIKKEGRFSGYNLGKNLFIKQILEKSKFQDLIVTFCMHEQEWDTYNSLFDSKYKYCFALYQGPTIIGCARIEEGNNQISMKFIKNLELKNEFINIINKWQDYSF